MRAANERQSPSDGANSSVSVTAPVREAMSRRSWGKYAGRLPTARDDRALAAHPPTGLAAISRRRDESRIRRHEPSKGINAFPPRKNTVSTVPKGGMGAAASGSCCRDHRWGIPEAEADKARWVGTKVRDVVRCIAPTGGGPV